MSAMATYRIPLFSRALAAPRRSVCATNLACGQRDFVLMSERQETFSSEASKAEKRSQSFAQLAGQSPLSNCSEQRLRLTNQRYPQREPAPDRLIEAAQ
jgi:hypothetical protein